MNLSVQNHIMSNTNYALIQKTTFKGKILTQNAFKAEPEIVEMIKTLPKNVFMDSPTFSGVQINGSISAKNIKKLNEITKILENSS